MIKQQFHNVANFQTSSNNTPKIKKQQLNYNVAEQRKTAHNKKTCINLSLGSTTEPKLWCNKSNATRIESNVQSIKIKTFLLKNNLTNEIKGA